MRPNFKTKFVFFHTHKSYKQYTGPKEKDVDVESKLKLSNVNEGVLTCSMNRMWQDQNLKYVDS